MDREDSRLQALDTHDILDTGPEESFDRLTRLTRSLFQVPMATIGFLDSHREWFKSRQGLDVCEVERAPTLCNIAIQQDRPLIIEDTLADARYAQNHFVRNDPHIRFYAGVPLRTPQGDTIGILCAMDTKPRRFGPEQIDLLSDLGRIALTELELRAVAATDSLTGIMSRRAFMSEAERALALAIRHRTALTSIAIDRDHFKAVNDRFGHGGGDGLLIDVAKICTKLLRKSDLFGRLGGEEFAILLPHTGGTAATDVAEKLRAAIAGQATKMPSGETANVTASFGIATLDRSAMDVRTLLEHADEALYAAKRDGRNRCKRWTPPAVAPAPTLRRRVLKAGSISFNLGRSTIDCTVRGLSDEGAALDVISTADLPDMFKLRVPSEDLSRPCKVVSKKERRLEVAFA